MNDVKTGFLVPVYNHGKTALSLAKDLDTFDMPIILVDDGSNDETKSYLQRSCTLYKNCILITQKKNCGKGAAINAGIDKAHCLNLSHVLQIDADGQHDFNRAIFFLSEALKNPQALICGYPEYDETVPQIRKKGRVIANTWTKIVTLDYNITDSMCGFRVYPVEPTRAVMRNFFIDKRMGFDIEILVRLVWKNTPTIFYPVSVTYPHDGTSNFHFVRDNIRISLVFTRLFFGMILRLPILLSRKMQRCKN
ncbi:MAG: hypothetical protein Ta2F_05130 [Termitinemataceae bacterium]|nr:MAG: hypothetical protein Ta2F_05130 [Termitinemataceae bacterium]